MPFELDKFLAACKSAIGKPNTERSIRELVTQAVSDSEALMQTLGAPRRAGIDRLHVAEDLTVLNVIWAPRMTLRPHNHNMWAVIGVYSGREDNIFWRRRSGDPRGRIEAAGAKSLGPKEVCPLGRNIIHSVTNPTSQFAGAIHVYGGDFFSRERSEWDPEDLEEHPYNLENNLKLFEDSNAIWQP